MRSNNTQGLIVDEKITDISDEFLFTSEHKHISEPEIIDTKGIKGIKDISCKCKNITNKMHIITILIIIIAIIKMIHQLIKYLRIP